MAERADKGKAKGRLSLSRTKRKGSVAKAATPASAAATSSIKSFFCSQPPPKLACPLCGQLVPRFRINEHIDLQCQNFERGDSTVGSASSTVVSSTQLSPRRSLTKTPELDRKVEEVGKETKTSPYFKKNNLQQAPREINSKTVVRTIDLGSLSSKLSRKYHNAPERKEVEDENELEETLNSSQKENVLIQSLEDKPECVAVVSTGVACAAAVEGPSHSEKQHILEKRASKPDTVQKLVIPELHSSPPKPAKRKNKTASTGKAAGFQKKAKLEEKSSESTAGTTDPEQRETLVPSSACDPPLISKETHKESVAVLSDGLLPVFGADTTSDQRSTTVSPQLPYYLRNFKSVLHAVLENDDDRELFNQDDLAFICAFENLSGMPKCYSLIILRC